MLVSIAWVSSLAILVRATTEGLHDCPSPSGDPKVFAEHEFDYVIIGTPLFRT